MPIPTYPTRTERGGTVTQVYGTAPFDFLYGHGSVCHDRKLGTTCIVGSIL